jgi:hypothetical protein
MMVIAVPDHNSTLETMEKFRSILADFDYQNTLVDREGQVQLISPPFKDPKELYKTITQIDFWKRFGDKKMCKA